MTMTELYEYLHCDEGLPVTLSGVREAVRRREIHPTRIGRGNFFSQKDGWDWIRVPQAARAPTAYRKLLPPIKSVAPVRFGGEPGLTTREQRVTMSLPENPRYVGGYAAVAHAYIDRGWTPPLPLPHAQKSPPPAGFTGGGAQIPTPDQVEIWRREKANGNPALYLAEYDGFALLGVDIDNYAKGGRPAGRALEVIAEVEQRAGCTFASTYVLRNRTDGSEKRIYRVPCGLLSAEQARAREGFIHHHHRYVNAGINPGTGNPELWYDREGQLTLQPPRPEDFTDSRSNLSMSQARRWRGAARARSKARTCCRPSAAPPTRMRSPPRRPASVSTTTASPGWLP